MALTKVQSEMAGVGQVLQVVQGTTSTQVGNSTNTFADTGLTATITPKSATSKILVLINHIECQKDVGTSTTRLKMNLCRNGSQLLQFANDNLYTAQSSVNTAGIAYSYLDSPSTTSATTYKTQFANAVNAAAVYVQNSSTPSTITLMEIAG